MLLAIGLDSSAVGNAGYGADCCVGGDSNTSVAEAISLIESKSGFTFFYNAEDLAGIKARKVDLDKPVNDVLAELFKGTDIIWKIQGKEIILKREEPQKERQTASKGPAISGIVTDAEDGQPIIGASVMIEGTTTGTITDVDGKFTIEAGPQATLLIESLGYVHQKVAVEGRTALKISMKVESTLLDAVVMMGYSSMKKTELSSSVVSMKGETLRDVTTPDVGNMLQGKVAGVLVYNASGQPGEAAQIRVRGTGSISASASPLYVVDGIPGGSFNPNDVETISVLKDAGATALYGSDAAGGVIVVTTKKAKKGQATAAEFKAQAGIKQALSGRFSPMDSEELYDLTKSLYSKAIFNTLYPKSLLDQDFDWMNAAFQLGVTQDYYGSVAGSSEKVTYFVSLDHYREKGTLINTNYANTTGRVNLGFSLARNLDMNLRVNYSDSRNQGTSSYVTLESAYRMSPWDNPHDVNTGEYLYINSDKRPDNGGTWYSHDKFNIFHNELYNSSKSNGNEFTADLQLAWRITDHLSVQTTNRFQASSSTWKLVIDPRTANASYPKGVIQKTVTTGRSFSTSNLLKYSRTFNSAHNFNALVGYEWGLWKNDYTSAQGVDMKSGLTVLNASSADGVGGYYVEGEGWSVFGQAQYSYMEKY
ncbi:MAG: SusC/RagA family TonB-linked outer membrane protein, partial [Clostridium sp.]|nr:SusC/RagA family TonB-linked outer membrane protein [Clostridium sp.]